MDRQATSAGKPRHGFSLIELMVAVAIVGILAAIAYPSYLEQIRRSRRAEATAALLEAAQFMERCYTANSRYDRPCLPDSETVELPGHLQHVPQDGSTPYYDLTIAAVSQNAFTLQAAPVNAQSGDGCGNLTLTNTGARAKSGSLPFERCWR